MPEPVPPGRLAGQRVLVVTQHPYPDHRVVRRNIEQLAAEGAEVDVVCLHSALKSGCPGVRTYAVRLQHRRRPALRYVFEYIAFFLWAVATASWLCLRRRYDAVQVDNLPDFLVFAAWAGRLRGARVVLFMLELMPELVATRLGVTAGHPLVGLARALERSATAWADQVITVSGACRRRLEARGVDPRKLWVVPGCVPLPAAPDAGPSGGQPYAVVLATLIPRYGVDVAIRALALMHGRQPRFRLLVVGDGDARPALMELARSLNVADRVDFLGVRPWEEAMRILRGASVGLVPVIADGYGELLLPTKILEYASLGVPVVSARLPTLLEHFPPGSVAYHEPGDSAGLAAQVDRLLSDPGLARAQSRRARRIARELSWERVRDVYVSALRPAALEAGLAV